MAYYKHEKYFSEKQMKGWSVERKTKQRELNWDLRLQHYAVHNSAMFVKMTDEWESRLSFPYATEVEGDILRVLYISREHGILSRTMEWFGRVEEEILSQLDGEAVEVYGPEKRRTHSLEL
jgi:hypothetical protein